MRPSTDTFQLAYIYRQKRPASLPAAIYIVNSPWINISSLNSQTLKAFNTERKNSTHINIKVFNYFKNIILGLNSICLQNKNNHSVKINICICVYKYIYIYIYKNINIKIRNNIKLLISHSDNYLIMNDQDKNIKLDQSYK